MKYRRRYSVLNKAYVFFLGLALFVLALSAILKFAYSSPNYKLFLSLAAIFALIGIASKILIWYSVYSEAVTKEELKEATANYILFKKK